MTGTQRSMQLVCSETLYPKERYPSSKFSAMDVEQDEAAGLRYLFGRCWGSGTLYGTDVGVTQVVSIALLDSFRFCARVQYII